jgi:hypothetical protein
MGAQAAGQRALSTLERRAALLVYALAVALMPNSVDLLGTCSTR